MTYLSCNDCQYSSNLQLSLSLTCIIRIQKYSRKEHFAFYVRKQPSRVYFTRLNEPLRNNKLDMFTAIGYQAVCLNNSIITTK